jgi:hypothetical protein
MAMTLKGTVAWESFWGMPDSEFDWLYDWCEDYNERVEKEIEKAKRK